MSVQATRRRPGPYLARFALSRLALGSFDFGCFARFVFGRSDFACFGFARFVFDAAVAAFCATRAFTIFCTSEAGNGRSG
jgi:hypothetical protein